MIRASAHEVKGPKLWWKLLWVAVIMSTVALGAASFLLTRIPLERIVCGVALTLVCIGITYYIRIRTSRRVNRVVYILIGITPIGFVIWIVLAVSGIGGWLTYHFGVWPSIIISFTVPYIIGAFIGDWIGRRRDYRLPLSP